MQSNIQKRKLNFFIYRIGAMEPKYTLLFHFLPCVFLICSFYFLTRYSLRFLTVAFGIPMNTKVNAMPGGWLTFTGLFALFLIIILVEMLFGYIVGLAVNSIILRYGQSWSWKRIKGLIFYSELPDHWKIKIDDL